MIKLFLFIKIFGIFLAKYEPTTIVKKKHILQLNLYNFETALKQHNYLFILVYGSACPHAKKMLKAYEKFTAHLFIIKSKFETGIIHSNNRSEWKHHFQLIHNPTMLIYIKGKLIISRHWSKRLNHALKIMQKKVMQDKEQLMVNIVEDDNNMQQQIQKHPRSLIYIGDDYNKQDYFQFLQLSYRKKHYEFQYIRIKNSQRFEIHKLYLYQQWNDKFIEVKGFPNLTKTIDWLYHHSDHTVLQFPKPALTHIIQHRNLGFILLFKNQSDIKLKKNQDLYEQFELASQELYKSFKFTTCSIDKQQCKELITKTLKGNIEQQYPRIILIIPTDDFRSDFIGIQFNEQITKKNLIDFSQNFHSSNNLKLELQSEDYNQQDFNKGILIGQNVFETIKNYPEYDQIIFYYRSGLKKDLKLLDQYQKFCDYLKIKSNNKISFYFYDIEKNFQPKIFENQTDLPSLQVFKQKQHKRHAKVYRGLKKFIQIQMFINDQLTEDYSKQIFYYKQFQQLNYKIFQYK